MRPARAPDRTTQRDTKRAYTNREASRVRANVGGYQS